jgi:hypothetical protein
VTRTRGVTILAALLAAAAILVIVELAAGAWSYGSSATKDACSAQGSFTGGGVDGAIQRIVLDGLYGAACELGTTREELVLSLVPAAGTKDIRWDRKTLERAVRAGMLRAVSDAEDRGEIGSVTATLLRAVVERAPIDWLLGRAQDLSGLAGDLRDLLGRLGGLGGLGP